MSDLIPLKRRGTFQGYMNIVFASGTSLGGPIGGITADIFGWRWSFGIQIPLIVLSTYIISFRLYLPKREGSVQPMREKLKRIDFVGAITLVRFFSRRLTPDFMCFNVDTWDKSWRKWVAMVTPSCSYNSASFRCILRLIPDRGGKVCERANSTSAFTESPHSSGRCSCILCVLKRY